MLKEPALREPRRNWGNSHGKTHFSSCSLDVAGLSWKSIPLRQRPLGTNSKEKQSPKHGAPALALGERFTPYAGRAENKPLRRSPSWLEPRRFSVAIEPGELFRIKAITPAGMKVENNTFERPLR